jgi:hypothetical protein
LHAKLLCIQEKHLLVIDGELTGPHAVGIRGEGERERGGDLRVLSGMGVTGLFLLLTHFPPFPFMAFQGWGRYFEIF